MKKWATNSPVSVGVLLVVAGLIALYRGWDGAAQKDYVQGQLPYVISGGLVGISLVAAGLLVINIQTRRADQAELLNRLEALIEARDAARDEEPTPADRRKLRAS